MNLPAAQISTDVVVYGATPSGVCAAIGAAREGCECGVSRTHRAHRRREYRRAGIQRFKPNGARSVARIVRGISFRIEEDYNQRGVKLPYTVAEKDNKHWTYEPHVAQRVILAMLKEAQRADLYESSAGGRPKKKDKRITRIVTANGDNFSAKTFVDASYEGDLMARGESKLGYRTRRA